MAQSTSHADAMPPGHAAIDAGRDDKITELEQKVRREPNAPATWRALESAGTAQGTPERVVEVYRSVLTTPIDANLHNTLARAAVAYGEEWLGEEPEPMQQLLRDIVVRDPLPRWAFDRLAMALTVAESWEPLLALYDQVLSRELDDEWRKKLLRDGAQIAKDFADDAARGISFLLQLLRLEPDDTKLAANLERWAERRQRWDDLVEAWHVRATVADRDERRSLWSNIVACLLDQLDQPQAAFDELKRWLTAVPGDEAACQQLERIVLHDRIDVEMRHQAISLLRSNQEQAGRTEALLPVFERALMVVSGERQVGLRRELAHRYAQAESAEAALRHYAAILLEQPGDLPVRQEIVRLAASGGLARVHIDAFVAAGERTGGALGLELVTEACTVAATVVGDDELAVELCRRALAMEAAVGEPRRELQRELVGLYDKTGRPRDRLEAIEALLELEDDAGTRRSLRREQAALAEQLGLADQAIVVWQRAIDEDETDAEARDELIDLCEREQHFAKLADALRARADNHPPGPKRRADLERLAEVVERHLGDRQQAAEIWLRIHEAVGGDSQTYATLDRLLGELGRWRELAEVLRRRDKTHSDVLARLFRSGEIFRVELGDHQAAIELYGQVLELDPAHPDATSAVRDLVAEPASSATAVQLLSAAYRRTGDAAGLHELLERRLELEADPGERASDLRGSARYLEGQGNLGAAHALWCRALVLDPYDRRTQDELLRVTQRELRWREGADALRDAAEAVATEQAARRVELRVLAADLYVEHLQDHHAARQAYAAAVAEQPSLLSATKGWLHSSVATGCWQQVGLAAWRVAKLRGALAESLVASFVPSVDAPQDAWRELAQALVAVEEQDQEVDASLRGEWCLRLARWFDAPLAELDQACRFIARAREHLADRSDTLGLALQLHRRRPSAKLVEVLTALDRQHPDDAAYLREACEVAQRLKLPDARRCLEQLSEKCRTLSVTENADRDALDVLRGWTAQQLVDLTKAVGDLGAVAHWQLEQADAVGGPQGEALRRQAATTLVLAGQRSAALEIVEGLSTARPDDVDLCRERIELCQALDRPADLLRAYKALLALSHDDDELVRARLAIVQLTLDTTSDGGVVALLRTNLERCPGEDTSLQRLTALLTLQGNYSDLARVLDWQAGLLREGHEHTRAADLWTRATLIYRQHLGDQAAAATSLAAACEAVPDGERIAELIRLYEQLNDPAAAAYWLARQLESADEPDKVAMLLRLAHLQQGAELRAKARESLASAFDKAPRNREVRDRYLGCLRIDGAHQELVGALARASEAIADPDTVAAYAREARDLATFKLKRPEAALPALRRAAELADQDDDLAQTLGECLAAAGELEEARRVFVDLIGRFGRRRSPERAQAHVSLSRVLQKLGRVDEAITELEAAVQIDSSRHSTLARLGQLAAEAEHWETAERSYRMLLLALGRASEASLGDEANDTPCSRGEVLYELSAIACARGNEEQAQELAESALDAAVDDPAASARLRATLWARGDRKLLSRLLEAEAAATESPRHRARLWAELARLWQAQDVAASEVLHVWLQVVAEQPACPDYHVAAQACAARAEAMARYESLLDSLSTRPDVVADPYARCEVLLRRGEVFEQRLEQPERARECYDLAERTEVRVVDVWRAQARLAAVLGELDRQAEILEQLANVGEDEHGTRAAALYTLAEIQLARIDTATAGVAALERALEEAPNPARALDLLQTSCDALAEQGEVDMNVLVLYEKLCRANKDDDRLLHCLQAVAFHDQTTPEQVRAAYELAHKLERTDAIETLLGRAIALSEDVPDGVRRYSWAFLAAAESCVHQRDLAGAGQHYLAVFDALDEAARERVYTFAKNQIYADDGSTPDLAVALRIYERGLELESTARRIWEPLADLYAKLDNLDALRLLHDDIVDALPSREDRIALRCILARALVAGDDTLDEAAERLQEVLDEDPDCAEAQELLAECMAKSGEIERLVELLEGRLEAAYDANDLPRAASLALRLGGLFEQDDLDRAIDIYRDALDRGADTRKLLLALRRGLEVRQAGDELTRVYERLLAHESDPGARAALAVLAARRYREDDDLSAARRVLEAAHDEGLPDAKLVAQLEDVLTAMDEPRALAKLLVDTTTDVEGIERLRRAATLYTELGETDAAVHALEKVRSLAPEDVDALEMWCSAMRQVERVHEIVAELTLQLESTSTASLRAALLRLRGEAYALADDGELALADYESAFALEPSAALADRLRETVVDRIAELDSTADPDLVALRDLTIKLAQLHAVSGNRAEQRAVLAAWVERDRRDTELLREVVTLATGDEDWEAAVATSNQLVAVTSDEEQLEAARWLDRSAAAMGDRELARRGLEHVRRKQPEVVEIRDLLVSLYEDTGARGKLAKLLLGEVDRAADDEERAALLGRAGELAVASGESELAIEVLSQAVALRPEQYSWVIALADAHVYCGDMQTAAQVVEAAIDSASRRRGPEVALLQRKRANLADLAGDNAAQLAWLEHAMASDRHNLEIAGDLATAAEEANAWDLALKALRAIVLSDEATAAMRADSFARQGRIALINGDRRRAMFYAHKARHEDNEVPVVQELDRLLEESAS